MSDQQYDIIIYEDECVDVQTIPHRHTHLELKASLIISETLGELESARIKNLEEKVTMCVSPAIPLEDLFVQSLTKSARTFDEHELQQ